MQVPVIFFYVFLNMYLQDKFLEELSQIMFLNVSVFWDFPGGPVVKNPPSNAGNSGSIPGLETKISRATKISHGQLSPCAATPEKALCLEKPIHPKEEPVCPN